MRFSIAYNDDGTVLTSSSGGEDAEKSQVINTANETATIEILVTPRLPPVLREQPSPLHRTETQATEK
jgi:hypothetical protein